MPADQPSSSAERARSSERTHPSTTPESETNAATPVDAPATLSLGPVDARSAPPSRTLPDRLPAAFGRYQLIKLLGRGGMGAVYLARDSQLDRPVALKVPHFSAEDGSRVRERFLREARAAAVLRHANICPIYDVGELDGVPYLTMAYIDGRSLAETLRDGKKPQPPTQAAALVRKLALALVEAHRHQVIHRDLKPGNIVLTAGGEPVLMDFGLARRGDSGDIRLTQQGAVLGTPAYMAPEQAKGDGNAIGPACDIYSLGVLLYELLTRRLPFTGDTFAVLAKVLTEKPTPPSRHRPEIDARIESICLKAMAKEPAGRYASMADFAAELTEYLNNTGQTMRVDAPANPPNAGQPFVETTSLPLFTPPRKRRWAIALLVAALLVLLGVGAMFFANRNTKPVENQQPKPPPVAVEEKGDDPVTYVWRPDALRDGKIAAPDLSQVSPLFQDEFDDPASGFPKGRTEKGGHCYRDGKYFIEVSGRGAYYWVAPLGRVKPAKPLHDFACQLVGQVTADKARWGLCLIDHPTPNETQRLTIAIGSSGLLHVSTSIENRDRPLREPVSHPGIKAGEGVFNTLLVVSRGRQLEVYVNGVAVCDPILLERSRSSPRLALEGRSGTRKGAAAEFDRITVWPADSIPPLAKRGATAERGASAP